MFPHASPPPRTIPSPGVRGHPTSTNRVRTPLLSFKSTPTIVEAPTEKRCGSSLAIWMLAPRRLASPAIVERLVISHSIPACRRRSLEFLSDKYSATSRRPASRALCSASDNAAAHASSSSLNCPLQLFIVAKISRLLAAIHGRWYHEARTVPHK